MAVRCALQADMEREAVRVEWERVDRKARQKYAQAEQVLQRQLELLDWEVCNSHPPTLRFSAQALVLRFQCWAAVSAQQPH